jgi:hypothetical protein
MNTIDSERWERMRAAHRPGAPALDVAAIMDAVRQEAAARPLRRDGTGTLDVLPTWVCGTAAALAILAAATIALRSIGAADAHIGQAWIRTVQPQDFADEFMSGTPHL